jgi:predicted phosphodiesterase
MLLCDDGAVVYLNGAEVVRHNMPAATILYTTTASSNVNSGGESVFHSFNVSPSLLVNGENILAVEIHQVSSKSNDISFNLELFDPALGDGITHLVRLTELQPDTRYFYQVGTDTNDVLAGGDADHYFVTSPEPGSYVPTRIWAVSDSHLPGNYDNAAAVRDAYLELAAIEGKADVFLALGDISESGADEEFQAVFDTYKSILRNTPLWPTRGNHERDERVYYGNFVMPANGEAGGVASGTEHYYSFDYGNIHIISLNAAEENLRADPCSPMYQWLKADLANNSQTWTIAYWHHAPYSKSQNDSDVDSELINMRENAVTILEDYGVDLVLCGHSHAYERSQFINGHYGTSDTFDPAVHVVQTGSGQQGGDGAYIKSGNDGTVYMVAGVAGQISWVNFHPAMYFSEAELGSLIIDVNGPRMDVRFLRQLFPLQIDDFFSIIKAPSVDAGDNQTIFLPDSTANLDGTVSENVVSILWEKVSGSGIVTFVPNAFVEDPIATFSAADIYVLRLTGSDGSLSNSDEVTITVVDPNAQDTTPPTPDPMTWASVPYATSTTSIAMQASTASDTSGVEYYFACISGGGHDSSWQDSAFYEDTGLEPSTQYTYQAKARDKSASQNETGWSTAESAITESACSPGTTHVESIVCGTAAGSRGKKYGRVTVTVCDNCGNPVSGAEVTATFTGDFNETLAGTTNASGMTVITTTMQIKKPSYTFCVDSVTHVTLTYDSNDNGQTCNSY